MFRTTLCLSVLLLGAGFLTGTAQASSPTQVSGWPPVPCEIPGVKGEARCGTFEVFEDRAAKAGRKIPLKVVVLTGPGPGRAADPMLYMAGGPGDSATRAAAGFAEVFAPLRAKRDIVLIDVRGTGGSAGLFCRQLANDEGVQGFLDKFMPVEAVAACRAELEKSHNLALYTSETAMDDVAEVLTALGVAKANFMGGSYGTRAVQIFLRRHPERVRTIVLEGVDPTDERGPLHFARYAQDALDGTVAECAGDPACRAAFPRLAEELNEVLSRLRQNPVTVEIVDPKTGNNLPLRLTKAGFGQTLRYMMYVAATSVAIPLYVHEAAGGNFEPMAEMAFMFGSDLTQMSDGFYLSVFCAEDVAFIDPQEVEKAVAGTFLGDFRASQQLAACAAWNYQKLDPKHLEPVHSGVPALLISGERDPVTPPSAGARVARHLPNSLHLVVADGAHSPDGLIGAECLFDVTTAFIEAGTVQGLDTSCVRNIQRAPFWLKLAPKPNAKLTGEELERAVGRFRAVEEGFELQISVDGSRLRATIPGEETFLLAPFEANRFAILGAPAGFEVRLEPATGKVTGLTIVQGTHRQVRLVPVD